MEHRLLRETIRQILAEQQQFTVGDLRAALKAAKSKDMKAAAIEMSKEAGKKGALALLKFIPGVAQAKDAIELGEFGYDLYKAASGISPKDKKKNSLWDILTIDPDTSAIVDDSVEAKFIKAMGDQAVGLNDSDPLPDIDDQLTDYLKGQYSGTHITR